MTMDELRDLVGTRVDTLGERVAEAIRDLGKKAAAASGAFSIASTEDFLALSGAFHTAVSDSVESVLQGADVTEDERRVLDEVLARPLAYLEGVLDGGGVALTLRDAFPEGDWDEVEPVTTVLLERFAFVAPELMSAVGRWLDEVEDLRRETAPAPARNQDDPTPRGAPPRSAAPGRPETLKPIQSQPAGADRLGMLLAYAGELGVRIKKVPKNPPGKWLDKLQEKLEEIGAKKGIPSPFSFAPDAEERGTEETMAFVLPSDPDARAQRQQRVEQLVSKAERAGLKLGSIPEHPTDDWLSDIEAKLDRAMETRRRERRERREKLARQRKERISRLERYATELGVDIGKIPPFPTEDWLNRAELRIAASMLPTGGDAAGEDSDRAGRLAAILARASEADLTLEVPPDPDEVWLGWAESQVDRASGGGDALAIGADPDDVASRVPTLLFEEDTVQEQRWTIDSDRFTIGRARNNDIQIAHDGQLSRQHCAIEADGDGWTVQDLRSTQGTKLNGQPVRSPMPLTPGDVITIGDTRLVFRLC